MGQETRHPVYCEDEIDLRQILEVLWRSRWFIVLLVVVAVGGALVASYLFIPRRYQSETRVMLPRISPPASVEERSAPLFTAEELQALATSEPVIGSITKQTGPGQSQVISTSRFSASVEKGNVLRVAVRGDTPEMAQRLAMLWLGSFQETLANLVSGWAVEELHKTDAVLRALEERLVELQVPPADAYGEQYATILLRQAELQYLQERAGELTRLTILVSPRVPSEAVSPRVALNATVAAVLGGIAGVVTVFAREWWRNGLPSVPGPERAATPS